MTTCPHCGRDLPPSYPERKPGPGPFGLGICVLDTIPPGQAELSNAYGRVHIRNIGDAVREALRAGRSDNLKLPEGDQKP